MKVGGDNIEADDSVRVIQGRWEGALGTVIDVGEASRGGKGIAVVHLPGLGLDYDPAIPLRFLIHERPAQAKRLRA